MRKVNFLAILTYIGICFASDYQGYDGCNCDPGTPITETNCDPTTSSTVIECKTGQVIDVQKANYGRTDTTICPHDAEDTDTSSCGDIAMSTSVIKDLCNKRQWCAIPDISDHLADPCPAYNKYLQIEYKCGKDPARSLNFNTTCESHNNLPDLELSCPAGQNIYVRAAVYGRNDKNLCPFNDNDHLVGCGNRDHSTTKMQQLCDTKNSCSVPPTNGVFGDPCVGVYKYLEAWWNCV